MQGATARTRHGDRGARETVSDMHKSKVGAGLTPGMGRTTMQWMGWLMIALGMWLIASPFALGYSALSPAVVNDGAFGALIVGLTAYSMAANERVAPAFMWLVAAAGLWVAFAPWLLGYAAWRGVEVGGSPLPYLAGYPAPAILNDRVVGFAVAGLGFARLLALPAHRRV